MRLLSVAAVVLSLAGSAFAAKPAKPAAAKPLTELTPGAYTAQLKVLACEGCGPWIVKNLKDVPELTDVAVDQDKRLLSFKVKPGAKLKVETLQKKLNEASDKMGMGADYTLKDLKQAEKKGEEPKAKK